MFFFGWCELLKSEVGGTCRGKYTRSTRLFLEGEATKQSLKARVCAQAVKIRVDFKEDDGVGAILVGLLEPIHGLLIFMQARVHNGYVKRRDILLFRLLQQLAEKLVRLRLVASNAKGVTKRSEHWRAVMRNGGRLLKFYNGRWIQALLFIRLSEDHAGERKIGVHLEGIAELADRLVVLTRHIQTPAQAKIHADGERIKVARAIHLRETLGSATHGHEIERITLVGRGIAGVEFDGTLKPVACGCPVPVIVELNGGQRRLGLGERFIQFQRFASGDSGLGGYFLGGPASDDS